MIDSKLISLLFDSINIADKNEAMIVFLKYINLYSCFILGIYVGINFLSENKKSFFSDIFSAILFLLFFISIKNDTYHKIIIIVGFFVINAVEFFFFYIDILPKSIIISRIIANVLIIISGVLININLSSSAGLIG